MKRPAALLSLLLAPGLLAAQAPRLSAAAAIDGSLGFGLGAGPLTLALVLPPGESGPGEFSWTIEAGGAPPLCLVAGSVRAPRELAALADPLAAALSPATGLPWSAFRPALPPPSDPLGEAEGARSGLELRLGSASRGPGACFAAALYGTDAPDRLALGLGARLGSRPAGGAGAWDILAAIQAVGVAHPPEATADAWLDPGRVVLSPDLPIALFRPSLGLRSGGLGLEAALLVSAASLRPPSLALEAGASWKGNPLAGSARFRILDPSAGPFVSLEGKASGSGPRFEAGTASLIDCTASAALGSSYSVEASYERREARPLPDARPLLPLDEELGLAFEVRKASPAGLDLWIRPRLGWKAEHDGWGGWEGRLSADLDAGAGGKAWAAGLDLSLDRAETGLPGRAALPFGGEAGAWGASAALRARLGARLGAGSIALDGRASLSLEAPADAPSPPPSPAGRLRISWIGRFLSLILVLDGEGRSRLSLALPGAASTAD